MGRVVRFEVFLLFLFAVSRYYLPSIPAKTLDPFPQCLYPLRVSLEQL
jgi:hypothetical protein